MSLRRGTLVRPYDSVEEAHTCIGGVCVGRLVFSPEEGEPDFLVKWLERCSYHESGERFEEHKLDDLWEIGQIY